jgi:hypothetical protein
VMLIGRWKSAAWLVYRHYTSITRKYYLSLLSLNPTWAVPAGLDAGAAGSCSARAAPTLAPHTEAPPARRGRGRPPKPAAARLASGSLGFSSLTAITEDTDPDYVAPFRVFADYAPPAACVSGSFPRPRVPSAKARMALASDVDSLE